MKIARVIRVVDTRDWEEISDGKWAPVPGSGDSHVCDHCGRDHEVHVHVELDDGSTAIIGSSCARGGDAPAVIRRAVTKQHTLDKALFELRGADQKAKDAELAWQDILDGYTPQMLPIGIGDQWARRGDARAKITPWSSQQELERVTLQGFRHNRMREAGFDRDISHYRAQAEQAEQRYQRLVRRHKASA